MKRKVQFSARFSIIEFLLSFIILFGSSVLLRAAGDEDFNNPPTPTLSTQLEEMILEASSTNKKVNLDLFVMSHCPYGLDAEMAIIPYVKEHADQVNLNIYYIANETENGEFESMHGSAEVEEDIRQLIIKRLYPDQYLDYILQRAEQFYTADWEKVAENLELDTGKINLLMEEEESEKLFRDNIDLSWRKEIYGSPTMFINTERFNKNIFNLTLLEEKENSPSLSKSNKSNPQKGKKRCKPLKGKNNKNKEYFCKDGKYYSPGTVTRCIWGTGQGKNFKAVVPRELGWLVDKNNGRNLNPYCNECNADHTITDKDYDGPDPLCHCCTRPKSGGPGTAKSFSTRKRTGECYSCNSGHTLYWPGDTCHIHPGKCCDTVIRCVDNNPKCPCNHIPLMSNDFKCKNKRQNGNSDINIGNNDTENDDTGGNSLGTIDDNPCHYCDECEEVIVADSTSCNEGDSCKKYMCIDGDCVLVEEMTPGDPCTTKDGKDGVYDSKCDCIAPEPIDPGSSGGN